MDENKSMTVLTGTSREHEMQELFDREFPRGALCVVMHMANGRIAATQSCPTGRLVCDKYEQDEDGVWYHVIIDPRERVDEDADTIRLWVGAPHRHQDSQSLWEATVRAPTGNTAVLRLNADPPERWRPDPAMRRAASARYADSLATQGDPG